MKFLKRLSAIVLSVSLIAAGYYYLTPTPIAHAAAGPQIFVYVTAAQRTTSAATAINGINTVASPANATMLVAAAGTLSNFYCYSDNPLTGTQAWQNVVTVNGSPTILSCNVTSSGNGANATSTISVNPGDKIYMQVNAVNSPNLSNSFGTLQFTPTTSGEETYGTEIAPAVGPTYSWYDGLIAATINVATVATQPRAEATFPEGGTLSNWYFNLTTAPGAGKDRLFSLLQRPSGGSPATTTLAVDIGATNTTGSDTTDSVTIAAGDQISLTSYATTTATAAGATGMAVKYVPTNPGDFYLFGGNSAADSATVEQYLPISGNQAAGTPVIASSTERMDTMTITGLNVQLSAAPGAAKTRQFAILDNSGSGYATTSATCSITGTGTNTTCSWSGTLSVTRGDQLVITDYPTGTPGTTIVKTTITANANTVSPGTTDFDADSGWFEVL